MMKKLGKLLICLVLLLSITGCNKDFSDISSSKLNKVGEKKEEKKEEESNAKIQEVNLDEKFQTEFMEMTLLSADTAKELKPEKPKSVYRYLKKEEGKTYFYVKGTLKNISGEKYEIVSTSYISFTFDDKYNYSGTIKGDESGTFSYLYAYLDPMESETIYFVASIPDEVAESYQEVELKFGFGENFNNDKYNRQEKDCDYLYAIKLSK